MSSQLLSIMLMFWGYVAEIIARVEIRIDSIKYLPETEMNKSWLLQLDSDQKHTSTSTMS